MIAVVVQPGVEFGDDQVFLNDRDNAKDLTQAARELPHIVLEGTRPIINKRFPAPDARGRRRDLKVGTR